MSIKQHKLPFIKNLGPVNYRKAATASALVGVLGVTLAGCLISPLHNSVIASRATVLDFTAYAPQDSQRIYFECTKAYHGGLYPPFSTPTWTTFGSAAAQNVEDNDKWSRASINSRVPESCWRQDPAYDTPLYFTAVRARYRDQNGVLQTEALETIGQDGEVAKYSDGETPLRFARLRTSN